MSTAKSLLCARMKARARGYTLGLALVVLVGGCSNQADSPEQHLTKANAALEKDQLTEAEKEYREVLRLTPNDPVAQRQLAVIYLDQGQLLQAFPLLRRAAQANPNNLDLQIKLVRADLSARQFQAARDLAQQIVEKHPGQDEALMLLANAGIGLNDIDGTRKLLEDVRPEDKQRAGYHVAQGLLLLAQKDEADAESEFQAAVKADPKFPQAHTVLGSLYWARKDLKGAEAEFRTAADLAPKWSPLKLEVADFLLKTGALQAAKKDIEQINQATPDYLPPRVFLMRIACSEKQDDSCKSKVAAILKQDPGEFRRCFAGWRV